MKIKAEFYVVKHKASDLYVSDHYLMDKLIDGYMKGKAMAQVESSTTPAIESASAFDWENREGAIEFLDNLGFKAIKVKATYEFTE